MPAKTKAAANPLAALNLVDGVARKDGKPVPLTGERMCIVIRGGLALVSREQTFRNAEDSTIEATITFPVPVHATLCRLTAKIGDRILSAVAKPRNSARETYEKAIDDGKTAILHEELVRGVHVLSIAHILPGAELTVTHAWMSALAPHGAGRASLRIPVTLGQVYGDSPFSDVDDLLTSLGITHRAEIEIDAGSAIATIDGHSPRDGKITVDLNAPVDLLVQGDVAGAIRGIVADGRTVSVTVSQDEGGDSPIDAAILIDRSGSMGDLASMRHSVAQGRSASKHAAVVAGLTKAAAQFRRTDRTELWEFDSQAQRLAGTEVALADAIERLGEPRGGTEIGAALQTVVATSQARDIILVTDGLSHALDVQTLANTGRRFAVVLVGEDSFEANIGRLAALTGGQILLATSAGDAAEAVRTAIASVRKPKIAFEIGTWPLDRAAICAGGALVEASWDEAKHQAVEPEFEAAVGALAAAIAIPHLLEEDATKVAADHGIVCHLTSLVLVDEAGAVQEGLPALRKVALMASRVSVGSAPAADADMGVHDMADIFDEPASMLGLPAERFHFRSLEACPMPSAPPVRSLSEIPRLISWGTNPEALRQGDLAGLPPEIARLVKVASLKPEVLFLAGANRNPVAIVIALMAKSLARSDRAAERIARAVLKGLDDDAIQRAMTAIGL